MVGPRSYNEIDSHKVINSNPGHYILGVGGVVCDRHFYIRASVAQDKTGNNFLGSGVQSMYQWRTWAKVRSIVTNQQNSAVYVRPIYFTVKMNLDDVDTYSEDDEKEAIKSMMQIITIGKRDIIPTGDSGQVSIAAWEANNRRREFLEIKSGTNWISPLAKRVFKFRFGRRVLLGPGQEYAAQMSSKKLKRIMSRLHIARDQGISKNLLKGHTFGILWTFNSILCGTKESDVSANESEKVSTGSMSIGILTQLHASFKLTPKHEHAQKYEYNLPTIARANEVYMQSDDIKEVDAVEMN